MFFLCKSFSVPTRQTVCTGSLEIGIEVNRDKNFFLVLKSFERLFDLLREVSLSDLVSLIEIFSDIFSCTVFCSIEDDQKFHLA